MFGRVWVDMRANNKYEYINTLYQLRESNILSVSEELKITPGSLKDSKYGTIL